MSVEWSKDTHTHSQQGERKLRRTERAHLPVDAVANIFACVRKRHVVHNIKLMQTLYRNSRYSQLNDWNIFLFEAKIHNSRFGRHETLRKNCYAERSRGPTTLTELCIPHIKKRTRYNLPIFVLFVVVVFDHYQYRNFVHRT